MILTAVILPLNYSLRIKFWFFGCCFIFLLYVKRKIWKFLVIIIIVYSLSDCTNTLLKLILFISSMSQAPIPTTFWNSAWKENQKQNKKTHIQLFGRPLSLVFSITCQIIQFRLFFGYIISSSISNLYVSLCSFFCKLVGFSVLFLFWMLNTHTFGGTWNCLGLPANSHLNQKPLFKFITFCRFIVWQRFHIAFQQLVHSKSIQKIRIISNLLY